MGIPFRIAVNLLLFSLLVFACEREAWAYTDPGSGALLWQMLAAAFFGLAFYLRKLKNWFGGRRREKKG